MQARGIATAFEVEPFLATAGHGQTVARLDKRSVIYSQGAVADAVYYLKSGKIEIRVTSSDGKEAVLAVIEPRSFLGEGCLIGQEYRLATALAMVESQVVRVQKADMLRLLHRERSFAQFFSTHLLLRARRVEDDLIDQLFNSAEKRLARALLLLADRGQESGPRAISAPITHETLAAIVGTTRPRVSQFMSRFRKLGYISYDGGLRVHNSLLAVLLHEGETPLPPAQSSIGPPAPRKPSPARPAEFTGERGNAGVLFARRAR
jgi:CRP/FNR family cyclic AMP-dependent transcriptional regulator